MNKNYTLKELADIGAKAGHSWERDWSISPNEAFTKAVLDAIGYELPKDEEREAFHVWCGSGRLEKSDYDDLFEAWKAGREELRKAVPMLSFDKNITITSEPDWIPWNGGDKSPIVGLRTVFEVKYRDGVMHIYTKNNILCWRHIGTCADIIAYRILER